MLRFKVKALSIMYFVVFIFQTKNYIVVPATWLIELSAHTEKFMNYGVNSNQTFRVFYTTNVDAFDANGVPRATFEPNRNASNHSQFPNEGLYKCKITKYKGIISQYIFHIFYLYY